MSEAPIAIVSCSLGGRKNDDDDVATINADVLGNPAAVDESSTINQNETRVKRNTSKGWLMVGLVFIANFLVFGFFKSLGMLTKILNKEFAGATMDVYILMCIMYSTNCAAGPISCYLTRRYSARAIALVGTSMVTFGLILSWFARSLMFLYFSMGMFAGVGSGLTYPTGVILVSNYFTGTKNAAIANALVVSGSPIGGMVMPFILSFLSELYTSRGAFLIIGGIMFHAIICASSFRPPAEVKKRENVAASSDVTDGGGQQTIPSEHGPLLKADENSNIFDEENNFKGSKIHSCSTGIITLSSGKHAQAKCRECGTTCSVQTVRKYQACHPSSPPPSQTAEMCGSTNEVTSDYLEKLTVRRRGVTNILQPSHIAQSRNASKVLTGVVSQPYILALDHSCIILCSSQADVIKKPKHVPLKESTRSVPAGDGDDNNNNADSGVNAIVAQPASEQNSGKSATTKGWKSISPLGDPIYVCLLLSNTATAISTANVYLMVAQLVHETGDAYRKTSVIYLLFSSADLTGRIVGAFLCDKKIVTPTVIYAIGLVSAGISSSLLALLPSYMYLCIGTFVYGLSSGFHIGIYGLLLTNIVGIEKIHAGYGISMLINGTIQCMAILLSGSLISMFGTSFTLLAPVFGGILAGGGTLWICGSLIFKKKREAADGVPYPLENQNPSSAQNDGQNVLELELEDGVNNNEDDIVCKNVDTNENNC